MNKKGFFFLPVLAILLLIAIAIILIPIIITIFKIFGFISSPVVSAIVGFIIIFGLILWFDAGVLKGKIFRKIFGGK